MESRVGGDTPSRRVSVRSCGGAIGCSALRPSGEDVAGQHDATAPRCHAARRRGHGRRSGRSGASAVRRARFASLISTGPTPRVRGPFRRACIGPRISRRGRACRSSCSPMAWVAPAGATVIWADIGLPAALRVCTFSMRAAIRRWIRCGRRWPSSSKSRPSDGLASGPLSGQVGNRSK